MIYFFKQYFMRHNLIFKRQDVDVMGFFEGEGELFFPKKSSPSQKEYILKYLNFFLGQNTAPTYLPRPEWCILVVGYGREGHVFLRFLR